MNQNAIKRWAILGGRPLHWQFFKDQHKLVRIAAALYNCYFWSPEKWPYKRQHDESDFAEMISKFRKPSIIFPLVFNESFSAKTFDLGNLLLIFFHF